MVKNLLANAGDEGDTGSILEAERSPGGENDNPLVFLPGKSHGQRSLVGYSPWGSKESDMDERLTYTSDTSLLFVINVPNISSQDMVCLFTFHQHLLMNRVLNFNVVRFINLSFL